MESVVPGTYHMYSHSMLSVLQRVLSTRSKFLDLPNRVNLVYSSDIVNCNIFHSE